MGEKYEPLVWERYPNETTLQYKLFCSFKDFGPGRTLARAGRSYYGPTWTASKHSNMSHLSLRFHWVQRATAWDDEEAIAAANRARIEREEAQRRRINLARLKMQKGMAVLSATLTTENEKDLDPKDRRYRERLAIEHAMRLLSDGMKEERLELGEATETTKHEITAPAGASTGVFVYAVQLPDNHRPPAGTEEKPKKEGNG